MVVTSALRVLCYDHNLRKLWEQDLKVWGCIRLAASAWRQHGEGGGSIRDRERGAAGDLPPRGAGTRAVGAGWLCSCGTDAVEWGRSSTACKLPAT